MASRTDDLDTVKNIFQVLNGNDTVSLRDFTKAGLRRETVSLWLPVIGFIQDQPRLLVREFGPFEYLALEGPVQQPVAAGQSIRRKRRTRKQLYEFIFSYLADRGNLFVNSFEKEGLNAASVVKMVSLITNVQAQALVVEGKSGYRLDRGKQGYRVVTRRVGGKASRPNKRVLRARAVADLLKRRCTEGGGFMTPFDARSLHMAPATAVELLDTLVYLQQQGWQPLPREQLAGFASRAVDGINALVELVSELPAIKKQRISSMTYYTLAEDDRIKKGG